MRSTPREQMCQWLQANDIDPNRVLMDPGVTVTDGRWIDYRTYVGDTMRVVNGELLTEAVRVPVRVPMPVPLRRVLKLFGWMPECTCANVQGIDDAGPMLMPTHRPCPVHHSPKV